MTPGRTALLLVALPAALAAQAGPLPTRLWVEATATTIGDTREWTNKVEVADLDQDGDERSASRREHVFRNDGKGRFRDATSRWWPNEHNIGEDKRRHVDAVVRRVPLAREFAAGTRRA